MDSISSYEEDSKRGQSHTLSTQTHHINTTTQHLLQYTSCYTHPNIHILLTYPIQFIFSTRPINAPAQHKLSTHLINKPFQYCIRGCFRWVIDTALSGKCFQRVARAIGCENVGCCFWIHKRAWLWHHYYGSLDVVCTHPINRFYQQPSQLTFSCILSHPSQHTYQHIHPIITSILSTHLINKSHQQTLSTHILTHPHKPYQPTL